MKPGSDVLVLGGGVIGTSIAWFAAKEGLNVSLIEKGGIGQGGATAVSRGILRVYDPLKPLADLSLEGVSFYLNWPENLGESPTRHPGMIYRLKEENLTTAETLIRSLDNGDYPLALCRFGELKDRFRDLRWQDDDWVIYEPRGGFGDPLLTAKRFATGAAEQGATIHEHTTVREICYEKAGYWRVTTHGETFFSKVLVLAMGAATTDLLNSLPQRTRSIAISRFKAKGQASETSVIDEKSGTYLRPLDEQHFIAGSQQYAYTHWSLLGDQSSAVQQADAEDRVGGVLTDCALAEDQSNTLGFDGYTEDFLPLVQFADDHPHLILATGLSGRGYKMSPAIGRQVLGLIQASLATESQRQGV